jgi:hypothetical protein
MKHSSHPLGTLISVARANAAYVVTGDCVDHVHANFASVPAFTPELRPSERMLRVCVGTPRLLQIGQGAVAFAHRW